MANFQTATAAENEIMKAEDVTFGYEAAIDNVVLAMQSVLGSTEGSYVIGGKVVPYESGGLNVRIEPIFVYCGSTKVSVAETESYGPISFEEELEGDRIDIIQVRGEEEGYDYQVRMFNDPVSGIKTSDSLNTKKRIKLSVAVKKGTPGLSSAPFVDEGWVKIAEVRIFASNGAIQESQIANITAREYGQANPSWTSDSSATFNPGHLTEALRTFLIAHNEDGSHKDDVINGNDIDWGTGTTQVKGTLMPVGKSMRMHGVDFTSAETVTSLLEALVETANILYVYTNELLSRYSFIPEYPVAASTGNVNVASGGAMSIDGVSVTAGQIVLLKDQTNKSENGLWQAAAGAWSRAAGYRTENGEALTHKLIPVRKGSANAGKVFFLTGDTYKIGTDALEFQASFLSPDALKHTLMVRDQNGRTKVATPAESGDAATKGYVDGKASELSTQLTSHINSQGSGVHGATDAATAGRIVIRDASGRAKVASPSADADIANKGYVTGVVTGALKPASVTASGAVQGATLKSTGNTTVGGALSVTGTTTLSGAVTASGNVTAGGTIKGAQIVLPIGQPANLVNGSIWVVS